MLPRTEKLDGSGKVISDWAAYHEDAANIYGHYAGYKAVYGTNVDDATFIKKELYYNEPYDLLQLVAGCDDDTHAKYTVDQLKSFGLTFEFSIPTDAYTKNAASGTDQQQFAEIDGSMISSKLPKGSTNNRAAIDKAPIVRVVLKNGSDIIDEAYFKIKWVAEPIPETPDLKPITLDAITASGELQCTYIRLNLTWLDFIEKVYGATYVNADGETVKPDLSYDEFRTIYPSADIVGKSLTPGLYNYPVVRNVTSPDEDAQIARWTIEPDEFGKILPAREKTVEAQILFKSSKPKQYPDLILPWKYTVKLPAKPVINGYNNNQWFVEKEKFYVYPVQYGTKLDNAAWTTEVKYDFNVMQQFTVTTETDAAKLKAAGTYTNWIVKGVPQDCGTWDLQFAKAQKNGSYLPRYIVSADTPEPLPNEGVAYGTYGAYELIKGNKTALNLKWMEDTHTSWNNKEAQPYARLEGLKANKDQIIPLMNDLSVENESDNWTPKKTSDDNKSVSMKVWAKYNAYNVEEIAEFKAYLVTPIRINHKIDGAFEDLHISGTVVDAGGKLTITDFAGYAVAKPASGKSGERYKYEEALWDYYGLNTPAFDTNGIIFGLKMDGSNLVVDNSVDVNATGTALTGGMKMSDVAANTGGAFEWSITNTAGRLTFKNQTGRSLDKPFNVFVPVSVTHHFGEAKMYVKIPVYPKGQAAADGYTIINP